jgi:hypothetical protein
VVYFGSRIINAKEISVHLYLHLPRAILSIAGISASLLVIGGAAGAAITASPVSGGFIYGCYAKPTVNGAHSLILQNKGTSCPAGDTALSWNQQGPTGAPAPTGRADRRARQVQPDLRDRRALRTWIPASS